MNEVILKLTRAEAFYAGFGGFMRNFTALFDGRSLEEGRKDLGTDAHAIGTIVEYAVAKEFDLFWSPKIHQLDTLTGDLKNLQCKGVWRPGLSLIVRAHDSPDFDYVLGEVSFNKDGVDVKLCGWIAGAQAKQQKYWREKDPARGIHQAAYFVPQDELQPMETIPINHRVY